MAARTNNPTTKSYASSWPAVSTKKCTIAGIITNIFGLEELPAECTEVACLWLLHPRLQTQECMKPIGALCIADWNQRRAKSTSTKGLIAISFDQRNHGSREVDSKANQAWRNGNATHAQDMFSIYRGTALDTSLLLDHIASYAFPDRPIRISQNIVLGISLGGHAAWHVLLHDQRFDSGVVVIGCPDYLTLMSDRARLSKLESYTHSDPLGSKFAGSKDFPPDLVDAVWQYDPAGLFLHRFSLNGSTAVNPQEGTQAVLEVQRLLGGKRILNMSGGADKLVPYKCSERFLSWFKQAIQGSYQRSDSVGTFEDRIYDGVGHEFTPVMVEEAVAFISDSVERNAIGTGSPRQSKI